MRIIAALVKFERLAIFSCDRPLDVVEKLTLKFRQTTYRFKRVDFENI